VVAPVAAAGAGGVGAVTERGGVAAFGFGSATMDTMVGAVLSPASTSSPSSLTEVGLPTHRFDGETAAAEMVAAVMVVSAVEGVSAVSAPIGVAAMVEAVAAAAAAVVAGGVWAMLLLRLRRGGGWGGCASTGGVGGGATGRRRGGGSGGCCASCGLNSGLFG